MHLSGGAEEGMEGNGAGHKGVPCLVPVCAVLCLSGHCGKDGVATCSGPWRSC